MQDFLSKSMFAEVLKLTVLTLKLYVMFKKIVFCVCIFCSIFHESKSQVVDFEDLTLQPDTFWNGSDLNGWFNSGPYSHFPNNFIDYGGGYTAWDGFAYSNKVNDNLQDFSNMYSAFAGHQIVSSNVFGISYNPMNFTTYETIPTELSFSVPAIPQSIWVTNSTYPALTIKNGDSFSKKFGGLSGDDPDWFRLDIIGYNGAVVTDTIQFYLADYRFVNNVQDYIIKEWTEVNLNQLGEVTKIDFILYSTDTGAYGINTPSFFCFDNINCTFLTNINNKSETTFNIYPNPVIDKVNSTKEFNAVKVFDISGQLVYELNEKSKSFDISNLNSGLYLIKMTVEGKETTHKIVKE